MIIHSSIGATEIRHGVGHYVSIDFLESRPVRSAVALRDARERRARRRAFLSGAALTAITIFAVAMI